MLTKWQRSEVALVGSGGGWASIVIVSKCLNRYSRPVQQSPGVGAAGLSGGLRKDFVQE
jgi:hypothetical protein